MELTNKLFAYLGSLLNKQTKSQSIGCLQDPIRARLEVSGGSEKPENTLCFVKHDRNWVVTESTLASLQRGVRDILVGGIVGFHLHQFGRGEMGVGGRL